MLDRRIMIAAAALALSGGPALAAGVPAEAVQGDMSLGNPRARVHVVEYASASCPHCARFDEDVWPAFKRTYVDTGRAYYTLKEFLTPPQEVAAAGFLIARCGGKARYFAILDGVFRSQAEWESGDVRTPLMKVAAANGLSQAQVDACLADAAALKALNARFEAAMAKDNVHSTPTFDINGQRIEGETDLATLGAAISKAEAAAPSAKAPARGKGR
ncbi:MAG TPA: thioredoxin domain-containing protein [Phenylobacterium sp.]|uniref:thioredoxin domain-containing protein n=1 Tax=Phenylobacterium sp. TaxID=1871053 RepID=UPI002C2C062F|nr:thioredoxin domain-containing protein [Phenylobacterium sp.]HSV04447.1 thioredoxin domain-containing protein [Phenylobacterium sp.]